MKPGIRRGQYFATNWVLEIRRDCQLESRVDSSRPGSGAGDLGYEDVKLLVVTAGFESGYSATLVLVVNMPTVGTELVFVELGDSRKLVA